MIYMGMFYFLLGSILASFFMAWVDRSLKGESIINPPSHCNHCGTRLSWVSLIPVIGYVFFGGKCRVCKKKVPIIYPIGEAILGCFYVLVFITQGQEVSVYLYMIVGTVLFVASYMDMQTLEIYDIFSLVILPVGVICYIIKGELSAFLWAILFSGIIFLIFYLISKFYKNGSGFGEGDSLLMSAVCFFLAFPSGIYFLTLSFVSGSVFGVIQLKRKKLHKDTPIPFVPFLFLGFCFFMVMRLLI